MATRKFKIRLECCEVISLQLIKINEKKKIRLAIHIIFLLDIIDLDVIRMIAFMDHSLVMVKGLL